MSQADEQRAALKARVRELLGKQPITVQVDAAEARALDALVDAVLELVLQHITDAGGFCDYDWHISGADFGAFFTKDPNICQVCRKPREAHTAHPVLLCPDELAKVLQMEADQRRT